MKPETLNIIVLLAAIAFAIYKITEKQKQTKKREIPLDETLYNQDTWHYKMPSSAVKHLEECFNDDAKKVRLMQRAIELSIEHYAHEMADDAECARIINERCPEGEDVKFVPLEEMLEKLGVKRSMNEKEQHT